MDVVFPVITYVRERLVLVGFLNQNTMFLYICLVHLEQMVVRFHMTVLGLDPSASNVWLKKILSLILVYSVPITSGSLCAQRTYLLTIRFSVGLKEVSWLPCSQDMDCTLNLI